MERNINYIDMLSIIPLSDIDKKKYRDLLHRLNLRNPKNRRMGNTVMDPDVDRRKNLDRRKGK